MLKLLELASLPCMVFFKILHSFHLFDSTERDLTLTPLSLKVELISLNFSSLTSLYVFHCTPVHVVAGGIMDKVYHKLNF